MLADGPLFIMKAGVQGYRLSKASPDTPTSRRGKRCRPTNDIVSPTNSKHPQAECNAGVFSHMLCHGLVLCHGLGRDCNERRDRFGILLPNCPEYLIARAKPQFIPVFQRESEDLSSTRTRIVAGPTKHYGECTRYSIACEQPEGTTNTGSICRALEEFARLHSVRVQRNSHTSRGLLPLH
jgi:hypothetical protein